jgi:hypothetical protein
MSFSEQTQNCLLRIIGGICEFNMFTFEYRKIGFMDIHHYTPFNNPFKRIIKEFLLAVCLKCLYVIKKQLFFFNLIHE